MQFSYVLFPFQTFCLDKLCSSYIFGSIDELAPSPKIWGFIPRAEKSKCLLVVNYVILMKFPVLSSPFDRRRILYFSFFFYMTIRMQMIGEFSDRILACWQLFCSRVVLGFGSMISDVTLIGKLRVNNKLSTKRFRINH